MLRNPTYQTNLVACCQTALKMVMFFLEQEMVDSQTALKMVMFFLGHAEQEMVDSQTALKMMVILILHQKRNTKCLLLIHLTMKKFRSCKLQLYSTVCIGGMR